MKCKICGANTSSPFSAILLGEHQIEYHHCEVCEFLQTEEPYWLEQAYEYPINESDTGILMRNRWFSNIAATLIYFLFEKEGTFLDAAGGYGLFTRLMRDIGFDCYWKDKYASNLFAQGFEFEGTASSTVELLTCFEAFEHFVEPKQELEQMLEISENILFSTELLPSPIPAPDEWWYYGLHHGQHIAFFRQKTLENLAAQYDLKLYSNGQNIHLFTKKEFPPVVFKILLKLSKFLTPFIRQRMQTRIWEDYELAKVKELEP